MIIPSPISSSRTYRSLATLSRQRAIENHANLLHQGHHKFGASNEKLTDVETITQTGEELAIQARGRTVSVNPNPAYMKRYIELVGKHAVMPKFAGFDFDSELISLNELEPIAELDINASSAKNMIRDYRGGSTITVNVEVTGTVYTGSVSSGASVAQVGGCQVYDNMVGGPDNRAVFQVSCCGGDFCTVKLHSGSLIHLFGHHQVPTFLSITECHYNNDCPMEEPVCSDYGLCCGYCADTSSFFNHLS